MNKIDKVIKGLECCLKNDHKTCGYKSEDKGLTATPCTTFLMRDALERLKAQEPRVMTVEEVLGLHFQDVVYYDTPVGVVFPGIVVDVIDKMPNGEIGLVQFSMMQKPIYNADLEYYGKQWRCWTAKPSDEQRMAAKWKQ